MQKVHILLYFEVSSVQSYNIAVCQYVLCHLLITCERYTSFVVCVCTADGSLPDMGNYLPTPLPVPTDHTDTVQESLVRTYNDPHNLTLT